MKSNLLYFSICPCYTIYSPYAFYWSYISEIIWCFFISIGLISHSIIPSWVHLDCHKWQDFIFAKHVLKTKNTYLLLKFCITSNNVGKLNSTVNIAWTFLPCIIMYNSFFLFWMCFIIPVDPILPIRTKAAFPYNKIHLSKETLI